MHPSIVVQYFKAIAANVLHTAVGSTISLSLSFAILASQRGSIGSTWALVAHWLASFRSYASAHGVVLGQWIPVVVSVSVGAILLGPLAAFQFTRWRHPRMDAGAILPEQARTLSLSLGADAIFAVAREAVEADPSLYDVRADIGTGRLTARSVPFAGGPGLRGERANMPWDRPGASAMPAWKRRLLGYIDLPFVGSPRRSIDIAVVATGPSHCDGTVRSHFRTLLPALDPLAKNRRTVDSIVETLTARTPRLIAEQRSQAERAQLEKRLLDSRLQVLRAQIEPHFLFNTLANVQYLIRNDPPAADAMVGALISYLRQSLPSMRDAESTLGGELALARAYLDVLRIRMGARLSTSIDASEGLSALPFPPMMLMSLVENAIKHGLEPKVGGGRLGITASADERTLRVEVRDDGVGFDAAAGSGIGLKNIRETLASMFGDRARLVVEPNAGQGVTAAIEIPLGVDSDGAVGAAQA